MLKKFCSKPIINSFIKLNKLSFTQQTNQPPPNDTSELEKAQNQLIRKQNKDFQNITIQRRATKLPLTDTQVKNPSDFYDKKQGPLRETEKIFNFNEPALNKKS